MIPTYTAQRSRWPRWLMPMLCLLSTIVSFGITATVVIAHWDDHQVPQACLDAIAAAEDGFGYTYDAVAGVQRALRAAAEDDPVALLAAFDDIEAAGQQLDQLDRRWDRARADCRAAAE